MPRRPVALTALVLSLAAFVPLVAGCGGGSSASPPVASVPSTTGPTGSQGSGSTPSGSPQGGSSNARGSGFGVTLQTKNGAKLAACMRSHGIRDFPDPNSQGAINITGGPGSDLDPNSPKFQAAQRACAKLLPSGGQPSPAQIAKIQEKALAYSACMRSHGLPNYPDPRFSGGRVTMKIAGGPGSNLDPNSPKFRAAQKACQGKLPGKVGGGGTSTAR